MPSAPGIVVVDATFLKDLKNPASIARIESNMRAAGLEIAPSVPNVLEALKHPNQQIRDELLDAIRRWARYRPLNPWPTDLLRLAGEALPATEFSIGPAQIDALISHPAELQADHEKAKTFLDGLQANYAKVFAENRPAFQKTLKNTGQKYVWSNVGSFLSSEDWISGDNQVHLAGVLWELAGLAGTPPSLDVLHRSELWRIAMDGFGAGIYVNSILPNKMPNPPGFVDLMQLLYLSEHTRARILITDDTSFREIASQILVGRYINVRVMSGSEFLAQAV
jgi:hypothetical protein